MKRVFEILEEFKKETTREGRKRVLLMNDDPSHILQIVLQGAFHPDIKWVFKEKLPFKPSIEPVGMSMSTLAKERDKFYIFVEGSQKVSPNLSEQRKKLLAIQIMESLEPAEAEVFMNMMLKDLKVPYLTYKLVEETFPGMLPNSKEE